MKKIFKLRSELAFSAVISVIIALVLAVFLREFVLGSFLNSYNDTPEYVYENMIAPTENELKNMNMKDIGKLQEYMDGEFSMTYFIFIVRKDGNVIASNNRQIKSVDERQIVNGKNTFKFLNTDRDNLVKITRCDYLKDGYYLYYIYIGYGKLDNSNIVGVMAISIFIIVFFLLIWRRISYISKIKSTVRSIAEGNLSDRVPLKYKNELRELSENINYMASKIEKEEKNRNEFFTNISHDLRTPLTTILGYIDMIKNGKYNSENEFNNYIDIMHKKGLYLKNMLDDFFEYSKLSSNDIILEKQYLQLNELARQVYEEEDEEFIRMGLKLSLKLPRESIGIKADPNLFLRAVNNLLSNALKYSKNDTTVEFNVDKEKYNDNFYAVISVSNIPETPVDHEDVENFFERLYKRDLSRKKEGSGLGLSIVREIIKHHGGVVKAYKENRRLIFKLYIPCSNLFSH
ncbi:MAG: HAMP domain-containing histidine kinase [Clostridium sp.]|uniref:HAMP domain-containing sensor histidine kinase n=1 Tax=Clostridium sp. TaxID=1506 RepID=UPI0025C1ACD5|nr:HAMP domain-containing sensor histidine kinase [Clostridium sp.]MCH3965445.1 HAMP domain-containing histidine kinase [Clostridium sp.]MCI1717274.1 HAMP domain-containing histidine kinase [Clostridium sp.]MCI1801614.1 HAMP domain-containing histidine kinase [Clostridium sp.]MCI1815460.1 HAMP domain-containing histidine kinase [Clostridium sp.]MCI1872363.1 HAMP domain-containing histidine kinase [Clostridium sp.]